MADRFFVTGTGDNYSETDNWSSSSGGSGGSSVPGLSDKAIFDGNSPAVCDIDILSHAGELDCGAWSGTMTFNFDLQTYGNVTLSSNTILDGTEFLYFYDDNQGGDVNWNGADIQCGLKFGGTNGATWTMFDDVTVTGTQGLSFQELSDSSPNVLNGNTQVEKIVYNPATLGLIRINNPVTGSGDMGGTAIIEITGETDWKFNAPSNGTGIGLNFIIATGGDVHFWGYSGGDICRIIDGFSLKVTGSGTITASIQTTIPDFYSGTDASSEFTFDFASLNYEHSFRFNGQVQKYINNSAGLDIVAVMHYLGSQTKTVENNNGKLEITLSDNISSGGNEFRTYTGDADILFGTWLYISGNSTAYTCTFEQGNTYEFRDSFLVELTVAAEGELTFISSHASLKVDWHVWHRCRVNLTKCHATRITTLLASGQQVYMGDKPVLTASDGVSSEEVNRSVIDENDSHPFYNNNIPNSVTVSGTVELSATPQADARVHIITLETDPDGVDYYMLRHVLNTNGSGEWTGAVPQGSTVFVSAHYDSGGTKYNSLSKPFIVAA